MENQVMLGQYALAPLLTVVLSLVFRFLPVDIAARIKALVAVVCGMALSLVAITYNGDPWTAVNIIDAMVRGFMIGAAAVGVHELQKSAVIKREESKPPQPPT